MTSDSMTKTDSGAAQSNEPRLRITKHPRFTASEQRILALLLGNLNKPVSYLALTAALDMGDYTSFDEVLDPARVRRHAYFIRMKLGEDLGKPERLVTVGKGVCQPYGGLMLKY